MGIRLPGSEQQMSKVRHQKTQVTCKSCCRCSLLSGRNLNVGRVRSGRGHVAPFLAHSVNMKLDRLPHLPFHIIPSSAGSDAARKVWGVRRETSAGWLHNDHISHGLPLPLEPCLLKDAAQGPWRTVISRFAGDRRKPPFAWVLVLTVAPP